LPGQRWSRSTEGRSDLVVLSLLDALSPLECVEEELEQWPQLCLYLIPRGSVQGALQDLEESDVASGGGLPTLKSVTSTYGTTEVSDLASSDLKLGVCVAYRGEERLRGYLPRERLHERVQAGL
jgi:hypothetical protein